jgi:hypothetical protein
MHMHRWRMVSDAASSRSRESARRDDARRCSFGRAAAGRVSPAGERLLVADCDHTECRCRADGGPPLCICTTRCQEPEKSDQHFGGCETGDALPVETCIRRRADITTGLTWLPMSDCSRGFESRAETMAHLAPRGSHLAGADPVAHSAGRAHLKRALDTTAEESS